FRACRGLAQRQPHAKRGALSERAFDRQPAAMAVDDVLDEREPQAGAAFGAAVAYVDAIEAFGEPRQVLGRNAGAVVAHHDDGLARPFRRVGALQSDVDPLAAAAV